MNFVNENISASKSSDKIKNLIFMTSTSEYFPVSKAGCIVFVSCHVCEDLDNRDTLDNLEI